MRKSATASADAIDAATLWGAIAKSLPWLMVWSALVAAVTFGVLGLIAPRYQSEAQLTIDAKSATNPFNDPKQGSGGGESTTTQMDREAINTHIKSLQSPTLAAKIVGALKLSERAEFNAELGDLDTMTALLRMAGLGGGRTGQSMQDRVLEAYFKSLDVYSAKESRFIGLRFMSTDPQLAAAIPNALAEAYREQLAGRKVDETRDVQDALLPKIEQLTREVAAAEVAVEQFRGRTDSFNTGAQKQTLNEQQLGELTNELSRIQGTRSEAEARARSAQELMRGGSGEVHGDVQKSPLIQNLVQQRVRAERQIAELSATLLPGHPRMQQLNADLGGLKKQIAVEVGKIVEGLSKEAKVAAEREIAIKKRLADLKITVVNAGPDEAKLKMFVADAKSKREELERLQAQFNVNRTRAESKAVPVEAKVLSPAFASSVAVYPKKGAVTAIAAMAAFIVGLALLVLRAVAQGARSQGRAATEHMGHSRSGGAGGSVAEPTLAGARVLPALAAKASSAAMAVDDLVAHVLARTPERGGYRTLVAGLTGGVDASGVGRALAVGLARAGQPTILVEWTYGASMAARLGAGTKAAGMGELIAGVATFEDVITAMPHSECHLITAGQDLAGAAGNLDADELNLMLDALDEAYAHIVVVGEHDSVRHLFETIQGRCDGGVVVVPSTGTAMLPAGGMFLGFDVADIDIVHATQEALAADVPPRRLGGFGSKSGTLRSTPASVQKV